MLQVTVVSRPECHLCRVVVKMAQSLQREMAFALKEIDIADDQVLEARYGARIPVVLIDNQEVLAGKITEGDLRRAMKRARWRRPISRILSRLRRAFAQGYGGLRRR